MQKQKSLIRYHLESVLELAKEDGLATLEYLVRMAALENEKPAKGGRKPGDGNKPLQALKAG
jgi:hypothetical protein